MQSVPPIKLSAARENAGLTQVEAAEKLGISYQTLSRYENNVGSVRLDMLKKMSELYGIPVEFIFFK
ncbi:helix-turn-helix transcriptional regulator [Ligilactobacillus murinus]|uniref:helix-turn-helix transcriptional regulator n=1 Tax=Lactobacillus intestinalis TaxID=151781 RepID=UPI001C8C939E|nr:helix-turn-helix transcriptional regulator [Lactobacillus intestinalis]MBX9012620.1 helix-turn-helix transcriptional regulator [Ligilactobacillus murinus]